MGSNPIIIQPQNPLPEFVLHAFIKEQYIYISHPFPAGTIALIGNNKSAYGKARSDTADDALTASHSLASMGKWRWMREAFCHYPTGLVCELDRTLCDFF